MRIRVEQETSVPGAASVTVRSLLDGPPRPGRVVGVGPAALFVIMAEGRGVLALCTHDAVRLPLAIVVAAPTAKSPWDGRVSPGDGATVGGDLVRLPGLTFHTVRWWAPARPRPINHEGLDLSTSRLLDLLRERAVDLPAGIGANLRCLRRALATGDHDGARRAVDAMLGLGPGLTPAGDDVIAGLLLAVHHLGAPEEPVVRSLRAHVVAATPGRTTAVSAALVGQAAQGYSAPQAIAVLSALGTGVGLRGALNALLLVGHTSGGDLAHGIAAGAQLALSQRGLRGAA
jgi:hypothetical protein